MTLEKLNNDLLMLRRKNVIWELDQTRKNLSFPHIQYLKLSFADDLPKATKELSETNKVGSCLSNES